MVDYRSVSQVKEYEKCPHAYYLHRRERVWERPAAWLPHGLAVHEAAEHYEKSGRTMTRDEMHGVCTDSYDKHTNRLAEDTPNMNWWFPSGPYRGADDVERRFGLAHEQVDRYVEYYTTGHPDEVVWIDDAGNPAIELGFDINLDGVRVRGYIDQVIAKTTQATDGLHTGIRVRDIKTGNQPGDSFQLATYKVAVEATNDVEIGAGDYWMGRKGKPTKPYDLTDWTRDDVAARFHASDEGIRAERFDPLPDPDKCRFCSVSYDCAFAMA